MNVSFDIVVGKFKPSKRKDFPTKELIDADEFATEYRLGCVNLRSDSDILKIISMIDLNITREIEHIAPQPSIGFNGMAVEDSIYKTYKFWIDTDCTVYANCDTEIVFDVFADENHKLTSGIIYQMLNDAVKTGITKSGMVNIVSNFELSF